MFSFKKKTNISFDSQLNCINMIFGKRVIENSQEIVEWGTKTCDCVSILHKINSSFGFFFLKEKKKTANYVMFCKNKSMQHRSISCYILEKENFLRHFVFLIL